MCWHRQDRLDWSSPAERWERPPPRDLRVADADRQAVIDDLRRHTGDGRLTLEEFEERVDEVLQARTRADLDLALRELPSTSVAAPRRLRSRPRVPLGALVVPIAVVALLVAGAWWVLFPVGFFVFGGCGRPARYEAPPRRVDDRDDTVTYA